MRRLTAVIVLVLLTGLALSVITTRAQQPAGGSARTQDRKDLRARLSRLRAEVELLQLRHEAARAQLLGVLKRMEQLDFAEKTGSFTTVGMVLLQYQTLTGDSPKEMESVERSIGMAQALADGDDRKKLDDEAKKDIKRIGEGLRIAVETKSKEFTKLSIERNERTLELAEAEKKYNESN
jgi:hypothetical protein